MSNDIRMSVNSKSRVVDLTADVDFEITEGDDEAIHLADVVYGIVLDKCKDQEAASVLPGKHNVRLLAVVTSYDEDSSE